jgi:uncharacterized protein
MAAFYGFSIGALRVVKNMNIGITGASGFLGQSITKLAEARGHHVIGYSRNPKTNQRNSRELDFTGIDVVIHLAGENVLGLWTKAKKQRILDSRVEGTRAVVAAMQRASTPPRALISASGVSVYGERGDRMLDESSAPGESFLSTVVQAWEAAVTEATPFARTASLRIGMVLGPNGGAWPILHRIFKFGLGGRLGSGKQWMPWIHIDDVAGLFLHTAETESLTGPINAVAPEAVTNAQFTTQLATALRRPALIPTPTFALKLLPGGMSEIFLDSAKVAPTKALESGYTFQSPNLQTALERLIQKSN